VQTNTTVESVVIGMGEDADFIAGAIAARKS